MTNWANHKLRDKLRKLFALLGSSNAAERDAARAKIDEVLTKHKRNWNDLTQLLFASAGNGAADEPDEDVPTTFNGPPPLDSIYGIAKRHLHLNEHQLVAVSLWIGHSFVFDKFSITPRLVAISPVR